MNQETEIGEFCTIRVFQALLNKTLEYPILSKLLLIKQKLILLKKKETMIPQDILPLEHEVEETIEELIHVRGGVLFKKHHINNRTDEELNKVCQLISLCFMTIGKWHESK